MLPLLHLPFTAFIIIENKGSQLKKEKRVLLIMLITQKYIKESVKKLTYWTYLKK